MSKAYDLPGDYGYISGHSSCLNYLKELTLIEGDYPLDEINRLVDHFKTIRRDYVSIICVDLLTIADLCPRIHALFEAQYIAFSMAITLPQKFHTV